MQKLNEFTTEIKLLKTLIKVTSELTGAFPMDVSNYRWFYEDGTYMITKEGKTYIPDKSSDVIVSLEDAVNKYKKKMKDALEKIIPGLPTQRAYNLSMVSGMLTVTYIMPDNSYIMRARTNIFSPKPYLWDLDFQDPDGAAISEDNPIEVDGLSVDGAVGFASKEEVQLWYKRISLLHNPKKKSVKDLADTTAKTKEKTMTTKLGYISSPEREDSYYVYKTESNRYLTTNKEKELSSIEIHDSIKEAVMSRYKLDETKVLPVFVDIPQGTPEYEELIKLEPTEEEVINYLRNTMGIEVPEKTCCCHKDIPSALDILLSDFISETFTEEDIIDAVADLAEIVGTSFDDLYEEIGKLLNGKK